MDREPALVPPDPNDPAQRALFELLEQFEGCESTGDYREVVHQLRVFYRSWREGALSKPPAPAPGSRTAPPG